MVISHPQNEGEVTHRTLGRDVLELLLLKLFTNQREHNNSSVTKTAAETKLFEAVN